MAWLSFLRKHAVNSTSELAGTSNQAAHCSHALMQPDSKPVQLVRAQLRCFRSTAQRAAVTKPDLQRFHPANHSCQELQLPELPRLCSRSGTVDRAQVAIRSTPSRSDMAAKCVACLGGMHGHLIMSQSIHLLCQGRPPEERFTNL